MSTVPIYQYRDSSVGIPRGHETVWLIQKQGSQPFGRDRTAIGRHIKTLFQDGELARKSNVQKMHVAAADRPPATFYDLDVAISVAHHIRSREGLRLRQWPSGALRDHLVQGYAGNCQCLETDVAELEGH